MEQYDDDVLEAKTKVIISHKENAGSLTETFLYLQDLNGDGEIFFNVEYETKYANGSFRAGNGLENLDLILDAFDFEDYDKLSSYFREKYHNDVDAFKKIVTEIKSKGVELSVDESEGCSGSNSFFLCGGY